MLEMLLVVMFPHHRVLHGMRGHRARMHEGGIRRNTLRSQEMARNTKMSTATEMGNTSQILQLMNQGKKKFSFHRFMRF